MENWLTMNKRHTSIKFNVPKRVMSQSEAVFTALISNLENIGQFVWANQVPENTKGNRN